MVLKRITAFNDFRKYLKHYYDFNKREDPQFTYSYFSKKAGIKSPNFLKLIIDGTRYLTTENLLKVARVTSMSFEETCYFETLAQYQQAENPKDKSYFKKKLKQTQDRQSPGHSTFKKSRVFSEHHYPLLMLYLHEKDINSDHAQIIKLLEIKDIEKSIQELILDGVLEVRKNRYMLVENCLIFEDKSGLNLNLRNYFQKCLEISHDKFSNEYETSKHFFASQYLKINKKNFTDYGDRLLKSIEDISNHSDEDKGNDYYLLNIQLLELFRADGLK